MGRRCTLSVKWECNFFEENIQIFSDIDALAVSMSEKFLRSFFQKATVFSQRECNLSSQMHNFENGFLLCEHFFFLVGTKLVIVTEQVQDRMNA